MDNPYIGRIVTVASPFIGSFAVIIANWVQDLVGADLDETQLTVFLTGVFVATLGLIYKWLDNRGAYERLVEAGRDIYEGGTKYAPESEPEPEPLKPAS